MRHMSLILVAVFVLHAASSEHWNVHRRSKRAVTQKCNCSPNLTCPLKFQIFQDHTACLPKSSKAATTTVLTSTDKVSIVNLHNQLRSSVTPSATNMLKMEWDDEVAMIAQHWADACKQDSSGNFYHDKVRFIPGRFSVGQNIGTGYSTVQDAINAWNSEKSNYHYGTAVSSFDPRTPVGHYTQLVWAASYKLGCGLTDCSGKKFFVCNYAPAGNIFPFSKPYDTGAQCADCKTCVNTGLCDCGTKTCEMGGTLDPKTCTCTCKNTQNTNPNCQLNCNLTDPFYCGTQKGFKACNCASAYISSVCPQLCGLCPCAEPSHQGSPTCTSAVTVNKFSSCNGVSSLTPASILVGTVSFMLAAHLVAMFA